MPDFRRGAAAIAASTAKSEGGKSFRPFTPNILWNGDGDSKYLLFLNPLEDVPAIEQYIAMVNQKGVRKDKTEYEYYESVIARTDPVIGEASDPMVENWEGNPKKANIAVAVELEPVMEENSKGRLRPVSFEIKMTEYDRRVRDDEGELTDETETVEAPVIGLVAKSPYNFYNVITSFDANTAPIHEVPVKITQVGERTDVTFSVEGFESLEVDLGPLIDNIEFVSHLGEVMDDMLEEVDDAEDDEQAAILIGTAMLNHRLDELCDRERYDELYGNIFKTLDPWAKNKKSSGGSTKKAASRRERPQRRSQRKSAEPEATEPEAPVETEAAPEAEEKPKRTRTPRAKKEASEAPAEPANDKIKALRERAAKRTAKSE